MKNGMRSDVLKMKFYVSKSFKGFRDKKQIFKIFKTLRVGKHYILEVLFVKSDSTFDICFNEGINGAMYCHILGKNLPSIKAMRMKGVLSFNRTMFKAYSQKNQGVSP